MSAAALQVLRQFRLIFGGIRQHFREVETRCGLSGSQMWILAEAARTPGVGVSEVAGRMGIHQSTASILVDKLVGRGLLDKQRSPEDQRRVGLYPTPVGTTALADLPGPPEGLLPEALNALPEVVLRTLNVNLNELIQRLGIREHAFAGTPLADIVGDSAGLGQEKTP